MFSRAPQLRTQAVAACRQIMLLGCLALLVACTGSQPVADQTVAFNSWLDARFEGELDFSPMTRTQLGDSRLNNQLGDISAAGQLQRLQWQRQTGELMQARFKRQTLSAEGQRSWDVVLFRLAQAERQYQYRQHNYVFGRRGPQSALPNFLINTHKVNNRADMLAYIERLQALGPYLEQALANARQAASEGIRAPYFSYDLALSQIHKLTRGAPFDAPSDAPFDSSANSALWTDINAKLGGLQTTGDITAADAKTLLQQARLALRQNVAPAFAQIEQWLRTDRANVSPLAQGVWALPDGDAYYASQLQTMTTTSLSADAIHQLGLQEVARIQAEMLAIKNKVGFSGSLGEFFTFMRDDPQFYYPNTEAGRTAYLDQARQYLAAMERRLPEYFGILPQASLQVRRVEAFREQAGGAAHYRRGTPDGSTKGTFYVHLIDMQAASIYRLENLAYHEGLPGHHMQIAIQQSLTDLPRFRRVQGYTAYSEGWGLYAELLGKEMGFYPDAFSDFGRLSGEIWRAIRLVVDTGIHAKHWTEDEAVAYALANSSRPAASVRSEIQRYFDNPGQATAYKIGMLEILRLRQQARTELGDDFDIRAFHDAVLGSGPLPLPILADRIGQWVQAQQQQQ